MINASLSDIRINPSNLFNRERFALRSPDAPSGRVIPLVRWRAWLGDENGEIAFALHHHLITFDMARLASTLTR